MPDTLLYKIEEIPWGNVQYVTESTHSGSVRRTYHITGLDKLTAHIGKFIYFNDEGWRIRLLSEIDNFVTAITLEKL